MNFIKRKLTLCYRTNNSYYLTSNATKREWLELNLGMGVSTKEGTSTSDTTQASKGLPFEVSRDRKMMGARS